jgi:hypothetical protein
LEGKQEFVDAKGKIQGLITTYTASMGSLTATMGRELLLQGQAEQRKKILDWLWKGYYWQTNDDLRKRRAPDTGNWFLKDTENWVSDSGARPLICHGMGMQLTLTQLICF